MFCKNCGSQLNQGVKFCDKCGASVSEKPTSSSQRVFAIFMGDDLRFLPIWIRSSVILTILMTLFFGIIGSFSDGFWDVFIGILMLAFVLGVLATFIILWRKRGYIFDKPSTQELSPEENSKFKGLGGWLVLVILALFINLGFLIYTLFNDINFFSNGTVNQISDPSFTNYIPGYSGFLTFEVIMSALLSLAAIYLIYLFFKTKKEFPKYYIAFLIALIIYAVIEYSILQSFSDQIKTLIGSAIDSANSALSQSIWGGIIWGFYMVKSKRVKATFIN